MAVVGAGEGKMAFIDNDECDIWETAVMGIGEGESAV